MTDNNNNMNNNSRSNEQYDIYERDAGGYPLIKVLMRTYGEHKTLTEEALQSFLVQDYPNKQLIVFNTHKDPLILDKAYEQIRVINEPIGYDNIVKKTVHLLEQVKTGLFCIYDDDDIIMPYHLSELHKAWDKARRSGEISNDRPIRVRGNVMLFYWVGTGKVEFSDARLWTFCLYDILDGVQFYNDIHPFSTYKYAGIHDASFMSATRKTFKVVIDNDIRPSYIYRKGGTSNHVSKFHKVEHIMYKARVIDNINSRSVSDVFVPRWSQDYEEFMRVSFLEHEEFERNFNKRMSINKNEWYFIKTFLKNNSLRYVVEFGAGLSTNLFAINGINVRTYETMNDTIRKIGYTNMVTPIKWNGKESVVIPSEYTAAFIDGPFGGKNREWSYWNVANTPNVTYAICHDMHRVEDKAFAEKYFTNNEYQLIASDKKKVNIYKRICEKIKTKQKGDKMNNEIKIDKTIANTSNVVVVSMATEGYSLFVETLRESIRLHHRDVKIVVYLINVQEATLQKLVREYSDVTFVGHKAKSVNWNGVQRVTYLKGALMARTLEQFGGKSNGSPHFVWVDINKLVLAPLDFMVKHLDTQADTVLIERKREGAQMRFAAGVFAMHSNGVAIKMYDDILNKSVTKSKDGCGSWFSDQESLYHLRDINVTTIPYALCWSSNYDVTFPFLRAKPLDKTSSTAEFCKRKNSDAFVKYKQILNDIRSGKTTNYGIKNEQANTTYNQTVYREIKEQQRPLNVINKNKDVATNKGNGIVSVVIPVSKTEKRDNYVRTVGSVFSAADGVIEVLFMADNWVVPDKDKKEMASLCKPGDSFRVIETESVAGQRVLGNRGAEVATGEFYFRIDAHCKMSQSWDTKLKNACVGKTMFVCVIRSLDEKTWEYSGGKYTFVCMLPNGREKWWGGYHGANDKLEVQPTMSITGCGWFLRRDYYLSDVKADEKYGVWGGIGTEAVLKVRHSGGRVLLHKGVTCGHVFSTHKGKREGLFVNNVQEQLAKRYNKELLELHNEFKPVIGWEEYEKTLLPKGLPTSKDVVDNNSGQKIYKSDVIRKDETVVRDSNGNVVRKVVTEFRPVSYEGVENPDIPEVGKKITKNATIARIIVYNLVKNKDNVDEWSSTVIDTTEGVRGWLLKNRPKER